MAAMVHMSCLSRGVRLVSCRLKTTEAVAIGIWVGTGGRYEPAGENGISHFLEHLVFKGTRHRRMQEIKESVEGKGGALNGFTSEETTCFLAKTLRRHFPAALDILLDMTFFPALHPSDIERERGVIFEEIRMYLDLPQHQAYDRMMELLWPQHPLGRNLTGSFATITRMTQRELGAYQRRWYQPANITVVACGDISHEEIAQIVRRFFRAYRVTAAEIARPAYEPAPPPPQAASLGLVRAATQQIHMCLGMYAFSRADPDRYALALLHIILGANMSSRLFNEIREQRGYAYEIGTAVKLLNDTGAFVIHAGLVQDKVEAVMDLIRRTLRSVMRQGAGRDELTRAKEYFRGQFIMGLEDTSDRMLWLGEQVMTTGKIEKEGTVLRCIERVGAADLKRVAQRIFSARGCGLALVGRVPRATAQRLQAKLGRWV